MAKIKDLRKIVTEDFPSKYRDLVSPLAFLFNPFVESVVNALNKQLNFNDNFNASDQDLEVTLPLRSNLNVLHSVKGRVTGVMVTRVLNLDNNATTLTVAPFVEFTTVNANTIQITNIIGLTPGVRYRLRLVILGT